MIIARLLQRPWNASAPVSAQGSDAPAVCRSLLRQGMPFAVVHGRQVARDPRYVPGRHFRRPLRVHRAELRVEITQIEGEIGHVDELAEEHRAGRKEESARRTV